MANGVLYQHTFAGKMTQEQADKEIHLMQLIKASLQKIYDNKAPESVQRVF